MISITDIQDNVGGFGQGTTIFFTYAGPAGDEHQLRCENWYTENGGGTDLYDAVTGRPWTLEGKPGPQDWEVREHLMLEFLDRVRDIYNDKFEVINRLKQELVESTIMAADLLFEDDEWETL